MFSCKNIPQHHCRFPVGWVFQIISGQTRQNEYYGKYENVIN